MCIRDSLTFRLVVSTLCLESDLTTGHDSGSKHHTAPSFCLRESENIEGIPGVFQLFIVINGGDGGLTLGDKNVVIDVIAEVTLGLHFRNEGLEELVEDVVGPLDLLLLSDTGLLEKVRHDVATSQLSGRVEVDTDELTETGGVVIPRSFSITVGLQNGVGGHNLILKGYLCLLYTSPSPRDS